MRLSKLSVQRFQCIESADLDLGPGLNVLFGPNDLGKSSLAWAIRAVLLLQHSSAAHERFVTWYGGGNPEVALTLCDDGGRYWRVKKSFGGSAGRSILESSKDGISFTAEASGRQVDDKLRTMLRWGLQRPGGQGAPRGLPMSFLTHVLLAEQDDVRKVLFDSSLKDDQDESGRLRLIEALEALAQDPMFKTVLQEAQSFTDRAFTPTGRKKRSAGSPFIEVSEQLKKLQQERDELDAKVRDSALAEAKIRELNAERDTIHRSLEEATEELATAQRRLAARRQRDALHDQVQAHQATIRSSTELQGVIERAQDEVETLQAAASGSARVIQAASTRLEAMVIRVGQARGVLDSLADNDAKADRARRDLEEQQKTAQENLYDAEHEVKRTDDALRTAREAARTLSEAANLAGERASDARNADASSAAADTEAARALQSLEDAQQRLRDATSGDRAHARELRRKDLENRRLVRASEKTTIERSLERAEAVGASSQKARKADEAHAAAAAAIATTRAEVARDQDALTQLDDALAALRELELHGQLRQARVVLSEAEQLSSSAEESRATASGLRREAAALRAGVRADLPSILEIEALRQLREELRIAEARLSRISVVVRPARPLALDVSRDGVTDSRRTIAASTAFTANRVLVLAVEDLVEVEVTAGEEDARSNAAALHERWNRTGASMLEAHGVDTVEQIATRRRDTDLALHDAADKEREAGRAEERAGQLSSSVDLVALEARVAELEVATKGIENGELSAKLDALGPGWAADLKRRAAEVQRERDGRAIQLERLREQLTRAAVQLEVLAKEAESLRAETAQQQAAMVEPWAELVANYREKISDFNRDLEDIDRQLGVLFGSGTHEESTARGQVADQEKALSAAQSSRDRARAAAQKARDAAIKATTKLEAAQLRAREIDTAGVWQDALRDELPELVVTSWREAAARAVDARDALQQRTDALRDQLAQAGRERADAIQRARDGVRIADDDARGARARLEEVQKADQDQRAKLAQTQIAIAETRAKLAGANVGEARRAVATLLEQMNALEAEAANVDAGFVEQRQKNVDRLAAQLREIEDGLAKARGALEQVGGAIVRERMHELDHALTRNKERERELEVEYDAWKLLVETLRSTESAEGQHLGRALAAPVSQRFRQLTGGRYGQLELGAHLETGGLQAAGGLRDVAALSAGTQDQLATLLRLCIAEQLQSAIVLDDHLSQSDPARVAWFNDILRAAAPHVQIIFITCRPLELLASNELPAPGEAARAGAAGLIRAVDLTKIIRRFAISQALPSRAVAQATR